MTDIWTMRDIENRDDSGAPWETTGTLAALADYIDGALLSDLTDPSEAEEELRDIAARMRVGKWDNYDRLSLERFGIYFRLGAS